MANAASWLRVVSLALATSLAAPTAAQTNAGAAGTADATMIASQVRDQGNPCADPTSAERDPGSTDPDGAVWILTCKDASYRVQLVPDMAAKIEKID